MKERLRKIKLSPGRMLLRAAIRGVAFGVIPGGIVIGSLFEEVVTPYCDAAWEWLRGKPPEAQQQALEELAAVPPAEARAIAEEELAEAKLPPEACARLVPYLAAVPQTVCRALSRPGDGGRPKTRLTQLPRSAGELMALLPLRAPRFEPGAHVPNYDFELEALLGQGGFGEVWRARHTRRKSLPPRALKFCLDPRLQVSLERELELLDRIELCGRHEGIVRLLGTALRADPPFLMYEYVDGGDLVAWLGQYEGQPPPLDETLRILAEACEPLAFAHRHGVVHRDLKPANLLMSSSGAVKVSDFGIGALSAEVQADMGPLASGRSQLAGAYTPMYADLAQQRGEAPTPRADVYALGVITYQLAFGDVRRPLSPYWREDLEELPAGRELAGLVGACVASPRRRLEDASAVLEQVVKLRGKPARSARGQFQAPPAAAAERRPRPASSAARSLPPAPAERRDVLPGPEPADEPILPELEECLGFAASPGVDFYDSYQEEIEQMVTRPLVLRPLQTRGPSVDVEAEAAESFDHIQTRRIDLGGGCELELLLVAGGTFVMGAGPEDAEAEADERPQHRVALGSYWLGRYPVTQAQWRAAIAQARSRDPRQYGPELVDPSRFKGDGRPVEMVSWRDVQLFLAAVGGGLRLPTEAEWEHAARGGSEDICYGPLDDVAWWHGNSHRHTHPVGEKRPNAFGLHDMLGNVWEWCQDAYDRNAYRPRSGRTVSDPVVAGPAEAERVLRGGTWYSRSSIVRASNRFAETPEVRSGNIGFRVALSG
jgi:eukaryotic-like serine/threonine-protein kinase